MLPKGLLKEYSEVLAWVLRGLDVIAVFLAGVFAYFYKFHDWQMQPHYFVSLALGAFLVFFIFPFFKIYESVRAKKILGHLINILQAVAAVMMVLAGLAFLTKTGEIFSRAWFLTWGISSVILVILFRFSMVMCLRFMRSRGMNERRVIIIGAGELGQRLAATVQQKMWTGFRVIAFFDDELNHNASSLRGIPLIKTPENMSDYINTLNQSLEEVWIALPLREQERVQSILHQLRHHPVTTRLVLDFFSMDLLNHSITDLAGFPVVNLRSTPMIGMKKVFKSLEDWIIAAVILIIISPLLVCLALAVKFSSKGPIFFRQKRVGWNGQEFEMLKFRTMPVDAEEKTGPVWAKEGEKRATPIGAFLRKTSLDELPQFINVLCGDMSIVGPRPERKVFVEQFKEQIPRYMQKHFVKAGITGWAQINGWRGNTSLEKRIEYDLFYIENWSLWFDLKIIFLTLFRGFLNKNAY